MVVPEGRTAESRFGSVQPRSDVGTGRGCTRRSRLRFMVLVAAAIALQYKIEITQKVELSKEHLEEKD
jgi:hypothetical protein